MKRNFAEHIGSILIVSLVFGIVAMFYRQNEAEFRESRVATIRPYLSIRGLDFGNPLHRALFQESLKIFRPDSADANAAIVRAIDDYRVALFTDPTLKSGAAERGISTDRLVQLVPMYVNFALVFLAALLLTLYGAQSLGVYRFVSMKQGRESLLARLSMLLRSAGKAPSLQLFFRSVALLLAASIKGLALLVLFSPAYVVGYAMKSDFETGNVFFMIFLGVVSNGLLVMYANRFFTLLVSESRKGYVETALAKGLSRRWEWNAPGGISIGSLMRLRKTFRSHILNHIYMNARFQYLPAVKEQASFLITGLIIAEMALNIQGHLGYEMMQRILDREYDVVLVIAFGIFLLVKITDIVVDWKGARESSKYENRG